MVRMIDAEKYMELLKEQYLHHKSMGNSQAARAWQGAMQLLYDMPTLTPPNEWISVEERLPEDKQIVLFHQKNGFIYCAEYFAGNKLLSPAWFIDNDCWEVGEVTHWMPLPAPPGKDNNVPTNEPLTIEQLREMDEPTPVWWEKAGYWCLCERGFITAPNGNIYEFEETDGAFYRRPPEGEEDK